MTFEEFCKKEKKIELYDWQKEAARAYLRHVYKVRQFPSGKTMLTRLLQEFLSAHGNSFSKDMLVGSVQEESFESTNK